MEDPRYRAYIQYTRRKCPGPEGMKNRLTLPVFLGILRPVTPNLVLFDQGLTPQLSGASASGSDVGGPIELDS
jgi:hypothetical protein